MKVSFLLLNLGLRGSVRRVVELSNYLVRQGHEVFIYTSDGLPCEWLTCYAETLPDEQVMQDEHDVLIFFGDPAYYRLVQDSRAVVKALYVLGLNEKDSNIVNALTTNVPADARTMAVRECLHNPDFLILANCSALATFLEQIGVLAKPVAGGVNREVFYPRPVERDMQVILAGGAKRAIEGTTQVIETLRLVQETMADVRVEYYAKRGHSQSALAGLYSRSAVFLDCQHHGGWNNAVAEAMACGTPVVCTDIWGNRDFAVNKRTAMLADVPEKAAWAICRLLTEPDLYEMIRRNALEAIAPYTWERAGEQLLAALRERGL